jgi:hypothetical protein
VQGFKILFCIRRHLWNILTRAVLYSMRFSVQDNFYSWLYDVLNNLLRIIIIWGKKLENLRKRNVVKRNSKITAFSCFVGSLRNKIINCRCLLNKACCWIIFFRRIISPRLSLKWFLLSSEKFEGRKIENYGIISKQSICALFSCCFKEHPAKNPYFPSFYTFM